MGLFEGLMKIEKSDWRCQDLVPKYSRIYGVDNLNHRFVYSATGQMFSAKTASMPALLWNQSFTRNFSLFIFHAMLTLVIRSSSFFNLQFHLLSIFQENFPLRWIGILSAWERTKVARFHRVHLSSFTSCASPTRLEKNYCKQEPITVSLKQSTYAMLKRRMKKLQWNGGNYRLITHPFPCGVGWSSTS